jgi:hypothetical protein
MLNIERAALPSATDSFKNSKNQLTMVDLSCARRQRTRKRLENGSRSMRITGVSYIASKTIQLESGAQNDFAMGDDEQEPTAIDIDNQEPPTATIDQAEEDVKEDFLHDLKSSTQLFYDKVSIYFSQFALLFSLKNALLFSKVRDPAAKRLAIAKARKAAHNISANTKKNVPNFRKH